MTEPQSPRRLHTREDSGIRLDRQLRWWHDDVLVEHPNIIRAFNTGLAPTEDGRFILRFGHDWCFVQVEDAAYAVTSIDSTPDGDLSIRLSDGTSEPLDPSSLRIEEGVLTCRAKRGLAKARFSRDAQFSLGQLLEPSGGGGVVLRAGTRQLPVPNLDPAALTS